MQKLRLFVVHFLGELPEPKRPEPGSTALVIVVVLFAALAMLIGNHHGIGGDPLVRGSWRMEVHLGIPLAGIAFWELVVCGRARAVGMAITVMLLAPIASRFTPEGKQMLQDTVWATAGPCLFGLVLVLWLLPRHGVSLRRWSLGVGNWRWWLPRTLAIVIPMVPILVGTVWLSESLQDFYPTWRPARTDEAKLGILLVGLAMDLTGWEFLFRGYLLHAFLRRGDPILAIVMQAIPFFLLHGSKPQVEMISSLFGGLLAGWFCIKAQSSLPMVVIHWVMISVVSITAFWLRHQ